MVWPTSSTPTSTPKYCGRSSRHDKSMTQIDQPLVPTVTILEGVILGGERPMDEQHTPTSPARRPSGRDAKRASRAARAASSIPYITRKIPYYEVLSEEGLTL